MQGETRAATIRSCLRGCFNPLSLCRERRSLVMSSVSSRNVSIHSPYAGRDNWRLTWLRSTTCFNPLSLCRERRRPAGARPAAWVSIHSPYAGRDSSCLDSSMASFLFQSTLPMQGETRNDTRRAPRSTVSIHSPYAGRDADGRLGGRREHRFNPLSLCRERRGNQQPRWHHLRCFNPLSLCRERRDVRVNIIVEEAFQSTLPMQGETTIGRRASLEGLGFNPLSLCRERRGSVFDVGVMVLFQSTLPMQGETRRR